MDGPVLTTIATAGKAVTYTLVMHYGPFSKRHRLIHNGGLPKFEALYGSLNVVNSAEIS